MAVAVEGLTSLQISEQHPEVARPPPASICICAPPPSSCDASVSGTLSCCAGATMLPRYPTSQAGSVPSLFFDPRLPCQHMMGTSPRMLFLGGYLGGRHFAAACLLLHSKAARRGDRIRPSSWIGGFGGVSLVVDCSC